MCAAPELGLDDVDALVVGLSLLGSGGGGDAGTYGHVLRRALGAGPIRLHAPGDLDPDAPVVAVGVGGATRVLTEKLPGGHEVVEAVAAVLRWTGTTAAAIMAMEGAGLNGAIALVAAVDLGVPFVDADLMGRALPRLDQFTRAVAGFPTTPCALVEPGGQTVLLDGSGPLDLERIARAVMAHASGWAAFAMAPAPASQVQQDSCLGSIGRALRLGRAHAALPTKPPVDLVADALGGRVLADGRIVEIARYRGGESFGRGSVSVVDRAGTVLRMETENEFLLALADGEPVATCPDLICVLDRRTGRPIAVDAVRVGDEVLVTVLPGPEWWVAPGRLDHVAPRAFGLDCDPVLLAERQ